MHFLCLRQKNVDELEGKTENNEESDSKKLVDETKKLMKML